MPTLYDESGSAGSGGLERAKLSVIDNTGQGAPKQINVQFNPNSLKFSSAFSQLSLQSASGVQTTDTKSQPDVTMSVELLFDAINNKARTGNGSGAHMSRKSGRGTRIFPEGHGDIVASVNGFYEMMTDSKGRFVEFMWGRMHFKGIVTSVDMNITLFDRQARPMRATVSLQIKSAQ